VLQLQAELDRANAQIAALRRLQEDSRAASIGTLPSEPDAEDSTHGWLGLPDDMSDDAEALASAGFGTDEDYGYYGGDD
jgi:hypothetical protein